MAFASLAGADDSRRFLVRGWLAQAEIEYARQTEVEAELTPATVAKAMKRARLEGQSLVLIHTHPRSEEPRFSPVDRAGEERLLPTLFLRLDGRPQASLVIGERGFDARQHCPGDSRVIETLNEIGAVVCRTQSTSTLQTQIGPHADADASIWNRSVLALGEAGQEVLSQLRVGIVGLGGTGSLVAEQLAYLGIRSFVMLDPDTIEASNVNRVIGSTGRVGVSKVAVAADVVRGVRSDAAIETIQGVVHRAADARQLVATDFIFCCTDSHGSRAVVNQLAYQYVIPTIDLGIRLDASGDRLERVTGRVQMLAPGVACLLCQDLLNSEEVRRDLLSDEERARDPYIVGAHEPQPAVITFNGVVASLATTMFLAAVTGLPLVARHQLYLGERGVVKSAAVTPRPDCIVCSRRGALARGDTWRMPWRLT
ncbi:MAG TPA: ThiF family adenylyltransferase [Rhodothermales bacterium]